MNVEKKLGSLYTKKMDSSRLQERNNCLQIKKDACKIDNMISVREAEEEDL